MDPVDNTDKTVIGVDFDIEVNGECLKCFDMEAQVALDIDDENRTGWAQVG